MHHSVLPEAQWKELEVDIRETLQQYHVADELWLVHDLLVHVRVAIEEANLTTYKTAAKYYLQWPERLLAESTPQDEPFADLKT